MSEQGQGRLAAITSKLQARTGAFLGYDDIPLISIASAPSSIACAVMLGIVNFSKTTCAFDQPTNIYVWGLWVAWTITSLGSILTIILGARFGPFERKRRMPVVPWLLTIEALMRVTELGFNCYGVWLVYVRDRPVCAVNEDQIPDAASNVHAKKLLTVCLWLTWFTLIVFVIIVWIFWQSVRVATSKAGMMKWRSGIMWILKRFACCGCISQADIDAMQSGNRLNDITRMVYRHFQPASMSPTDVLAALCSAMLLQRSDKLTYDEAHARDTQAAINKSVHEAQPKQQAAPSSAGASDLQSTTDSETAPDRERPRGRGRGIQVSREELEDAEPALKYACAVFASTCPVQLLRSADQTEFVETHSGPCRSPTLSSDAARQWRERGGEELAEHLWKRHGIKGDTARLDYEIVRVITGRTDDEIAWFVTDIDAEGLLPYAVIVDPDEKKIIISIRGSAAMKDVITDMLMNPDAASAWLPPPLLEQIGDQEHFVHNGMKNSSHAILRDLQETGILNALLLGSDDGEIEDFVEIWPEASDGSDREKSIHGDNASVPSKGPASAARSEDIVVDMRPRQEDSTAATKEHGSSAHQQSGEQGLERGGNAADDNHDTGANERVNEDQLDSNAEEMRKRRRSAQPTALLPDKFRGLAKQDWMVELTGQSLGAGVAALMAIRLQYALRHVVRVHCWAFSPPGGLTSPSIAAQLGVPVSESCLTRGSRRQFTDADAAPTVQSLCLGEDVIPRATSTTLVRLRDQMVEAAARCRVWKWRLIAGCASGKSRRRMRTQPSLFYDMDKLPDECRDRIDEYNGKASVQAEDAGDSMAAMYPPGPLLLLEREGRVWEADYENRSVQPKWVEGSAVIDEGIIVSQTMMTDHLPYNVWTQVRRLLGKGTQSPT